MAHGFLTPTPVSGDNFWQNVKDLWKKLQELKKKQAPPEEVVPVVVDELQKALPPGRQKLLSPGSQKLLSAGSQKALGGAKAPNMLKGAPVAKMLGSGKSEITIKQQLALPPGGPKLPPSGGMPGNPAAAKGGSFVNMPGVSAAPKKLDTDAFFKAAQTGVDPETGRYLSSEERKDFLKKSKQKMDAPASVASAGASGISASSSIGEITKGDEQIVSSVEQLTKVVISLVDAVKSQTAAQVNAANSQKASAERTANRALASAEESSVETGSDLSSTISPIYGTNSGALVAGGSGGAGGAGGPGFGIGGKAIAQAVGKRGLGRALPRLGAHVAGKTGAKLGAQFGAKAAAKIGAGAVGKSLAKKIPGLGLLAGLGFGAQRLFQGDILGAAGEVASGAASTVPGLGTAASVGIDAALAARDMGVTPFAAGGIISSPTLSLMGEGSKKEGVFPLEGTAGKKTFEMFGEGMFEAQKKHKTDYAKIQSAGLRQYYENEDGGKKLAKSLADVWKGIKGFLGNVFNGLLGGPVLAATGNPADYLGGGVGGSTGERNAAAFLSTLEGGGGQNAADTFQVMLNRAANAKAGGAMKAYGNTLFDQITAQSQFSPFSAAIHDRATGDPDADKKYGAIRAKLGKTAAERKAKLLEIAGQPDGIAQLQRLFNAGSATEASKILKDFETGGALSKESAKGVRGAVSFRGQALIKNKKAGDFYRGTGGNFFFNGLGGQAASLNAVSAAPEFAELGGGSKLENDILAFRKARTKFGVSGSRVASDSTFNLAVRELRGAKGGSSINRLADDLSYQDVHRGEAHKKGYGFDIPVANREQASFVIQFFRSRGYETIHGRGEDSSGGHDHHVHVQAPKAKAKEFMMAMKPKPKTKPEQGTTKPTVEATRNYRGGGSGSAPAVTSANSSLGSDLANTSAQTQLNAMATGASGTTVNNIYNNQTNQRGATSSGLTTGASATSQIYNWKAARR